MITKRRYEALKILKKAESNRGIMSSRFAELYWPDHHAWELPTSTSTKQGMWKCGGSYIGKLVQAGLAKGGDFDSRKHRITKKGLEAMELYEKEVTYD